MSHSPRGGCGLKSAADFSHEKVNSHSPRGGCGLKLHLYTAFLQQPCHSPRGGCGLKSGKKLYVINPESVTLREEGVD